MEDFWFFQINYTKCENCKIAGGFHLAYQSLSEQVISAVSFLHMKYQKEVLIIGDSLGGAICTFAALDVKEKIDSVKVLYYSME